MKDRIHEQLSALVDDELPEAEQALLIRQLSADTDLQLVLSRYQLASDFLHGTLPRKADFGFHKRVHDALQGEAAIHAAPRVAARWHRPLAGMAIAASVAVVAVVSLQHTQQKGPGDTQAVAAAPAIDNYIRAGNAPAPAVPAANARGLDVYLVNHNEYAVNRSMQGMLPYVRIIGQDVQPDSSRDAE
jgi:sigma-E factor negative regulatory protein RseA